MWSKADPNRPAAAPWLSMSQLTLWLFASLTASSACFEYRGQLSFSSPRAVCEEQCDQGRQVMHMEGLSPTSSLQGGAHVTQTSNLVSLALNTRCQHGHMCRVAISPQKKYKVSQRFNDNSSCDLWYSCCSSFDSHCLPLSQAPSKLEKAAAETEQPPAAPVSYHGWHTICSLRSWNLVLGCHQPGRASFSPRKQVCKLWFQPISGSDLKRKKEKKKPACTYNTHTNTRKG